MRVWEKAGTYRPEEARVNTWLASIARYRAIDEIRKRKSHPDLQSVSIEDVLHLPGQGDDTLEDQTESSLQRQKI
jgi:RNA polymerase sigma-70 factor (ECF subfamily)